MKSSEQLALPIGPLPRPDSASFVEPASSAIVPTLRRFAAQPAAPAPLLVGERGAGKSHLLHACVEHASAHGQRAQYVGLADAAVAVPRLLRQIEGVRLVCVDDLEAALGQRDAEVALFDLWNRQRTAGGALLAAVRPGWRGQLDLPDLGSRLVWGERLVLKPLDDAGRMVVLQQRAERHGFRLSGEVSRYLVTRTHRNLAELTALLDRLAARSLEAKRRVTIPLVRELLDDAAAQADPE